MKRLWLTLWTVVLSLLLFSCELEDRDADSVAASGENQLYVVSWNVQTFFDAQTSGLEYAEFRGSKSIWSQQLYEHRLERLLDAIEEIDADVLVLQEIENITIKLFGIVELSGVVGYCVLAIVVAAVSIWLFRMIKSSPFGRVLKAMRSDELSVRALGRNTTLLKVQTFFISAAFSGLAGLIYASYVSYIDPTSFTLDESIFIITALFIGGIGNVKGPVLGAVFVVILPELLRFVGLPDAVAANLRQIIYGLALVAVMFVRPQGLLGENSVK